MLCSFIHGWKLFGRRRRGAQSRGPSIPLWVAQVDELLPKDGLEAGGEGVAEIDGQGAEGDQGFRGGGLEDALHFGGDFGALLVAVHAERAGEFVGDAQGFEAGAFGECAGGGGGGELVEEIEALADGGEVL